MAKTSFPFATGAGANVSEDQWRQMARHWLGTGVLRGEEQDLAVYGDSTGMQVKVPAGKAWVQGFYFHDDGNPLTVLPIAAADATNPRIDLIVLRLDFTAESVDYAVLTGTAAASPAAPLPTQTTTRWELPLAQVSVAANATTIAAANVTDRRAFAQVGAYKARASDNLLVNGGLEVWQRGNGAFTANNAYTADRWQIVLGGTSTLSVSKDTTNVASGSGACAALTYTHNAVSSLSQKLEDYLQLRGHSVAFTARVRGSVASAVRLRITDGASTWYSGYHSGGGSYETLSVVANIGTAATQVTVALDLGASGTYYLDNAMLVTGAQPQDYQPLTPADDLARCQRYYEPISTAASGALLVSGYAGAANQPIRGMLYQKVAKVGTPSLTISGSWTLSNAAQPSMGGVDARCAWIAYNAPAVGDSYALANTGGSTVTFEFNP